VPDSARERYRRASLRLPDRWTNDYRMAAGRRTGHAAVFRLDQVVELADFPEGGGFPKRFLADVAYPTLGVTDPARVLHICSGSVRAPFTIDRRSSVRPAVVADARALPFRNATFDWAIADPPYSREWARTLYGITARQYPTPGGIVTEALRVLRPGGRVGLLHYMVPPYSTASARLVGVWGITVGPGSTIRAWSVLEKLNPGPELPHALEDVRRARKASVHLDARPGELVDPGATPRVSPADRDETPAAVPISSPPVCACGCGREVLRLGRGRPAAFATAACRQRAYRRRERDLGAAGRTEASAG
jgi:SAM-dependent methyltransferase